jgi:hypothetical protein
VFEKGAVRTLGAAEGEFALTLRAAQEQAVAVPALPFAGSEMRSLWLQTRSMLPACLVCLDRIGSAPASELRLLSGVPVFFMFTGVESFALVPPAPARSLADGAWHHVMLTRFGRAVSLYVDGVAVVQNTITFSQASLEQLYSRLNVMSLGRRTAVADSSALFFDGLLDDVRIYSGSGSAATVVAGSL